MNTISWQFNTNSTQIVPNTFDQRLNTCSKYDVEWNSFSHFSVCKSLLQNTPQSIILLFCWLNSQSTIPPLCLRRNIRNRTNQFCWTRNNLEPFILHEIAIIPNWVADCTNNNNSNYISRYSLDNWLTSSDCLHRNFVEINRLGFCTVLSLEILKHWGWSSVCSEQGIYPS